MRTAVLGASGLVGRTIVKLLDQAPWVDTPPVLLVSARSAGTSLPFRGETLICRETTAQSWDGCQVALFSAGGQTSRQWGPVAAGAGCLVVDNSSAFRMEAGVPLVVPEINGHHVLPVNSGGSIIANPNCSTIQIAMALAPLDRIATIKEVQVTTLQAVSGAGQKAVAELRRQQEATSEITPGDVFPRTIAGNAIPAIGPALPDGSFEEEAKVERELRKILDRGPDLAVTCTATRVPVVNGHSAAVRVVCDRPVNCAEVYAAMSAFPGLVVSDDPHAYATALEVSGDTLVHVGRLRPDPHNTHALLMWVVADNLLKGAAWNAVQIAALAATGSRP